MKRILLLSTVLLGLIGLSQTVVEAKNSGTTPTAIRGTFYRYVGNDKWTSLKIAKHSALLKSPGANAFKITSSSKSNSHRLAYQSNGKSQGRYYFTLQAKLSTSALSPFPANGMSLTTRKIGHHTYKVVRGYQGGYGFDFIKGHRFKKDFTHIANNY